jgi:hypothetical protein
VEEKATISHAAFCVLSALHTFGANVNIWGAKEMKDRKEERGIKFFYDFIADFVNFTWHNKI